MTPRPKTKSDQGTKKIKKQNTANAKTQKNLKGKPQKEEKNQPTEKEALPIVELLIKSVEHLFSEISLRPYLPRTFLTAI